MVRIRRGVFQAEDGIRDLVRSRGLGDVYKRQVEHDEDAIRAADHVIDMGPGAGEHGGHVVAQGTPCLLYTSDAADDRSSVDLGGRRIIKNNNILTTRHISMTRKRETQTTLTASEHMTQPTMTYAAA